MTSFHIICCTPPHCSTGCGSILHANIILFIVFPRDGRVEGGGAKSSLANEADFNDILKFKIVTPADNT